MRYFQYSSLINAPVEVVWHFHERPDVLSLLTPPWQPVEIVRRQGLLEVGAMSEFRIWLGLVPVLWRSRHSECLPYRVFTDRQESGPMAYWVHRHEFIAFEGKTRLRDTIRYELVGGESTDFFIGWWIDMRLGDMFRYRHSVTQRYCEQPSQFGRDELLQI